MSRVHWHTWRQVFPSTTAFAATKKIHAEKHTHKLTRMQIHTQKTLSLAVNQQAYFTW